MKLKEIFKYRKRDNQHELGEWYVGWKSKGFCLKYTNHGYEDRNAQLNITLFGWHFLIRLPWKCSEDEQWNEEKDYGIYTFEDSIYFRWGHKTKSWDIPFKSFGSAVRWDLYTGPKDLHPKHWNIDDWKPYNKKEMRPEKQATTWDYIWIDKYDGKEIPCIFYVEEMEWRRKWLKWTSFGNLIKRSVAVEFSEEVGARKGSWKGGVMGISFKMLPGEHPYECMRRSNIEQNF